MTDQTPGPVPGPALNLDEIEARLSQLTSDDWSGYADDLGKNAGRCELFAGPWENGYRTGSVFAVDSDCGIAERDAALSEVEHLRGLVEDFQHGAAAFIADEIAPIQAERDAARATLARVEALHRPHTEKSGTIVCSGCLCVWPCFTEQIMRTVPAAALAVPEPRDGQ